MNVLLKHITRNMQENIGRTILIMLSLFIVAVLAAILTLGIFFFFMLLEARANLYSYEYSIHASTSEYISSDVINEIKTEFDILAIPEVEFGYLYTDGEYTLTELDGLNAKDAQKFKVINIEDEKDIELIENEVVITSDVAEKNELEIGEEFEYYGRDGNVNILKVKYIVSSLSNIDPVKIVTNENMYLKIRDKVETPYLILFGNYKGNNNDINDEVNKLEQELGIDFYKNEDSISEMIKTYLYPVVVIALLILIVIFVSLNSIVKIIINERIPIIGTFRSIGATKKQIMIMLICEMLMYTVVPIVLGSCIGIIATKGISSLLELMLTTLGSKYKFDFTKYIFPVCLVTLAVTVLFQMILSIMELMKVSKMSIKECIFNKHLSIYKYSFFKAIVGIFFLIIGIVTIIKYKQLTYWYCMIGILSTFISAGLIIPIINKYIIKILEKSKNPIVIMATNTLKNSTLQINTNIIFIVTACVALVMYSLFNYKIFVEESKQNQVKSDIYVEEMGDNVITIYDKTDEFYKLENVKNVSSIFDMTIDDFKYDEIKFANHTINKIHLVYSEDYEKLQNNSNLLEIDSELATNLKKYEIIVSEYYEKICDLKEGDTIILNWSTEEEHFKIETPISLKIVGFTDLSKLQNNTIIISSQLGEELNQLLFNGFSNTKYFIDLKDNSSEKLKETRRSIITELGIYSDNTYGKVFSQDGYIKNVKSNAENLIKFMIVIVVSIVGLSLIGIINNQTVSFMERRRELATLYSIALSRKQLNNMILLENLVAFSISIITSIIFYAIVLKLVEYTLQILLIPISMKITISGVLVLLLVTLIIMLAIQKTMREHIKSMNIVEEIKYE